MSLKKRKPKRRPKVIPPKTTALQLQKGHSSSEALIERAICIRTLPCWRCDQYISGVEDEGDGRNCKMGMYKTPYTKPFPDLPIIMKQSSITHPKLDTQVLPLPAPQKIAAAKEFPPKMIKLARGNLKSAAVYSVDHEKEFLRIFKKLTYMHSPWAVWQDFITMLACTISNKFDLSHYDEREGMYLKIIGKYAKEDQQIFPQLVAETVLALEMNQEQDFLGKLYMILELQNDAKSQFFTPYSVCECMAALALGDVMPEVEKNGYFTIHDATCGAGATLIAGIYEAKKQLDRANLNFQNHVLVVAQDIDMIVALMCYIQISLLGMAGYVKIGNSLTDPMIPGDSLDNYWFTPMYFSDVWSTRRLVRKMDALIRE